MLDARILIVEDDGIIGRHIQNILSKLGYSILDVLATGSDAVQTAELGQPDLVLMDISLEGDIDGIEAARQIHERFDIPVVFLTAYADDATLQRAKIADPFGYILKPFDEYGLHIAIEMAINKSELTKRLLEQHTLAEALRDTAAALNSTLDIDEVFDRILANASRVVPHQAADILLIEGEVARTVRGRGYEKYNLEKKVLEITLRVDQIAYLDQMVKDGQSVVVTDAKSFPGWIVNPGFEWIAAIVRAPIRIKGATVGFITLKSDIAGYFNQTHAERLRAFADQAAIAIENARLFDDIRQRARYLALLNELTQAALRSPDSDDILQTIGTLMLELYTADQVCISAWDEEQQVTSSTTVLKKSRQTEQGKTPKPCEHILTSMVLAARDVLAFEDTSSINLPEGQPPITFPVRSVLGLPLIAGERKLGAVLVGYKKRHVFKPEEIAWGEQTGGQIALAIHKERLFNAERQKTLQLTHANTLITGLARVAARMASASGIDAIMKTLGVELGRIDLRYVLVLADAVSHNYQIRSLSMEPARLRKLEKAAGIKLDQIQMQITNFPYYEKLIKQRQAVYIPDITQNSLELIAGINSLLPGSFREWIELTPGTRGIYLPLFIGDRVLGLLGIWGANLEETDLATMTIFASQVAVSLDNARLYSEVQQQAITDELTGLYNRRGIFEFGQEEIKRARRSANMPSLILLDIDFFKRVNDSYGHDTGDEVIREIAGRCRRNLREIDIMGRYGGEGGDEFVIVLPDTDLDGARLVADRLRVVIGDTPVVTDSGPINITVSLGVANLKDDSTDWENLLSRADLAMYAAKAAGRNCVMVN